MKQITSKWLLLPVLIVAVSVVAFFVYSALQGADRELDESYDPLISPANFSNSTAVTNRYLPFEVGKKYIFEGRTGEGREHNEVERLPATKTIMGITCIIVSDKVWLEGRLIEDTNDWYAQDDNGNVWYFGEDVDNYSRNGSLRDHKGSWQAGLGGAKAGIAMPADPRPGRAYRQEYLFNEAEDQAEIIEVGLTISTPFRTFENVIKTKETTELEPEVLEYKFYAPGVGLIKIVNEAEKEEIVLIEIRG